MTYEELRIVVSVEACILGCVITALLGCINRWFMATILSMSCCYIFMLYIWKLELAIGSSLIYGPITVLLWIGLSKSEEDSHLEHHQIMRRTCWMSVSCGLVVIFFYFISKILDNIH